MDGHGVVAVVGRAPISPRPVAELGPGALTAAGRASGRGGPSSVLGHRGVLREPARAALACVPKRPIEGRRAIAFG